MTTQKPKYSLSDLSKEEQESFMKDFNEVLNNHSVYFEPIPQYTRKDNNSPWDITCSILLQKKILIKEEPSEPSELVANV